MGRPKKILKVGSKYILLPLLILVVGAVGMAWFLLDNELPGGVRCAHCVPFFSDGKPEA